MAGTTNFYGISYPTSTDYVKDGATAMQTIATGFDSVVAIPTYNNQTGTSYTFVLADTGKTVTSNNASAVTFTIPPQSSVAWEANTTLTVRNLGAGVVTIAGGSGVTVTNTAQTVAQYGSVRIIRTASNAWTVVPASGGASALVLVKAQTVGSAVSSVTVSDAFSSTYDTYRISYTNGTSSTDAELLVSLGSITTGYSSNLIYKDYGVGGVQGAGQNAASSWKWLAITRTNFIQCDFDLFNPNLAKAKFAKGYIATVTDAGHSVSLNTSTTQATAFTLTPSAGTITGGTIYVYGYAKA